MVGLGPRVQSGSAGEQHVEPAGGAAALHGEHKGALAGQGERQEGVGAHCNDLEGC